MLKTRRGPVVKVGDEVLYTSNGGYVIGVTVVAVHKYGVVDIQYVGTNSSFIIRNVGYNPAQSKRSWSKRPK